MTDKQILEKARRKAIDGGWKNEAKLLVFSRQDGSLCFKSSYFIYEFDVASIIFNLEFAKALWVESGVPSFRGNRLLHPWEAHLQSMVIADDPIKYLGENI